MDENNYFVYLDITVGDEKVGRVVLELFKNTAPKTAENFRALCTGERGIGSTGKPLCYKNTVFHKAISLFMIQGGDTTNFDGTGGESIYGCDFEDETFERKHLGPGVLSMANAGPNTNGSQFFITVVACPHLDGKNVAFGEVRAGMGVVKCVAEQPTDENDRPLKDCVVSGCGELCYGEDWGINENDGTEDIYPPYPEDWQFPTKEMNYIEDAIMKIKNSGNHYFRKGNMTNAESKYQKALRYIECRLRSQPECINAAATTELACLQNLAATKLRQNVYREALMYCNRALALDAQSVKALYRRGQAWHRLGDYQAAQRDLGIALTLRPDDTLIKCELKSVQQDAVHYYKSEKRLFKMMFQ
ncbi:peptidyl-prolyl cis-trans isomerase D-like isoform X1 [Schistocerca gregaria]|uniref:peptidyl-prolyl cis-trans isomerase D-like isoform X1 n=1 Tax=Schistocerca gregaria TaxID=7010 RepID=UPI00211E3768|nr:peptidyl-prolyl cis-trans isomerase D-like isoform X1 [Schistocerca gregaria]